MMLAKKTKALIITFLFIISAFSFLLTPNANAQEIDDDMISQIFQFLDTGDVDFDNILTQHPFRLASAWKSNDTRTIKGDIEFNLYFSSVLLSQIDFLKHQDQFKLSLHRLKANSKTAEKLDETDFIKLSPEFLGDTVQNQKAKIKNINFTLEKGDYLLFGVQINQTQKPSSKIAEDTFENRLIPIIRRISSFLKTRDDNQSQEAAKLIDEYVLKYINELDIEGEEFASLINVFRSSSFYYGSKSYPSSVKFSSTKNESFNLYFRNEPNYEFNLIHPGQFSLVSNYFKNINQTKPVNETGNHYWPAINSQTAVDLFSELFSEGEDISQDDFSEDIINWAILFILKTINVPEPIPNNLVNLYLKENYEMESEKPEGKVIREKLPTDTAINFTGPNIIRNRILTNLSAELYLHYPKLITFGNIQIKASIIDLYNGEEVQEIATETISMDRATISEIIARGPNVPTIFTFSNYDDQEKYEIQYDHNVGLKVTVERSSILNLIGTKLLYNSDFYASKISYVYEETDNIKIGDLEDKNTYAGGSALFEVDVTSEKYDDTVTISFKDEDRKGSWAVESVPETFDIKAGSTKTIKVYVNSTADDASAYNNDVISTMITATGKTGIDSEKVIVSVVKEAVPFNFEVDLPEEIEIKHGENETIKIELKNKNPGFVVDTYLVNIRSENDFYQMRENIFDVPVYNDNPENVGILELTIEIPKYTDIESDDIIITIESVVASEIGKNFTKTYTIETKIITPNILENIFHVFEQLSERIGLDDIMGGYGAWLLLGLFGLIILILIIIAVVLIRRKYIELICFDRIKEITPTEKAVFDIEIVNPHSDSLTYVIETEQDEKVKERWNVSLLSQNQIVLAPGQKEIIKLEVSPTDYVKKDDWAEVKVIVTATEKEKTSEIETVTVIKDSKKDVTIQGVLHWPKRFKKGNRIETSFKLFNRGSVSAENLKVIIFVNGKEKNKVEDITIPRGGYADVELPWIAEKGKNEIKIIVK